MNNKNEEILLTNKQWSKIESKMCRILEFNPIASVENGKITISNTTTPYASISFQCSKESKIFKGSITHKEDFKVLWAIFKERKIDNNEEVLFFWSNEHYKNIFYSLLSKFMPKLWVMICKKSSLEIHTNPNFKPELTGEARWLASQPIEDFKPDVMK
jgi:hypothetical protein